MAVNNFAEFWLVLTNFCGFTAGIGLDLSRIKNLAEFLVVILDDFGRFWFICVDFSRFWLILTDFRRFIG